MIIGLILNYKDEKRSINCIHSLLKNKIDKVVIIDNSEDGGKSASKIGEFYKENENILIHINDNNSGFSKGVNTGISLCKQLFNNSLILLINNDAILKDGALTKLKASMKNSCNTMIAFPKISHNNKIRGFIYYQKNTGIISPFNLPGSFPYISGCCMLLNPILIDNYLFDEDFFMYGEDAELGWRLRNRHNEIVHIDEVLVTHEECSSSVKGSIFYEEKMVTAHLLISSKISKTRLKYFINITTLLPFLTIRALLRCKRFHSTIPFSALLRNLKIIFTYNQIRRNND